MSFPTTRNKKQGEPYDHMKDAAFFYDVTEQFKKGMKLDPQIKGSYEVTTISKVCVSDYLFASILVCNIWEKKTFNITFEKINISSFVKLLAVCNTLTGFSCKRIHYIYYCQLLRFLKIFIAYLLSVYSMCISNCCFVYDNFWITENKLA